MTRAARLALAAALGACALFLLAAPKPWDVPSGPGFFAQPADPLHEEYFARL